MTIPGVQLLTALTIVSEVGIESPRLPHRPRILPPGSACVLERRKAQANGGAGQTTKGNVYLRAVLAEVSWCLSRMKDNDLSAHYHHFTRHMVKPKAIVASSQSVAVVAYHVLKKRQPSQDRGPTYLDTLTGERMTKQALRRLEALGYEVSLTPKEVHAWICLFFMMLSFPVRAWFASSHEV